MENFASGLNGSPYYGNAMEQYTRSKTEFIQSVVDAARTEKGLPLQNVWED